MQTNIKGFRSAGNIQTKPEGLDDSETALLIRTGYVFDLVLVLVGLIAMAAGHVAGGLGVALLGVAGFLAGWVVVELSDHFHH
jgi:hypothetical protein